MGGAPGPSAILSHERGSALTWGDDPFDNYMINFGYELAETNGSNTGALTTKTFTESFSSFMTQRGRPPKPLEEGW